jgi:hypothetical protein
LEHVEHLDDALVAAELDRDEVAFFTVGAQLRIEVGQGAAEILGR